MFRMIEAAALMHREPTQIETPSWREQIEDAGDEIVALSKYTPASPEARQVIWAALEAGEAVLWVDSAAALYAIYNDPAFGESVDALFLAYNSELGLHVDRTPTLYRIEWLLTAIDRWSRLASMTVLAQHGSEHAADHLPEHTRKLRDDDGELRTLRRRYRAVERALAAREDEADFDTIFDTPIQPSEDERQVIAEVFDALIALRATLPHIPRPEDIFTQADADHMS